MRTIRNAILIATGMSLICLVLLSNSRTFAQGTKLSKPIFIQGTARGQAQQLGRMFSFNLSINELSTPEDQ
jgi:hypothetical protein